ncbi:ATP-dependent DNA ligase, partial [Nanoarchaeota archaeon]
DEERKEYNEIIDLIESAYNKTNDYGEVLELIRSKGKDALAKLKIDLDKAIKVMLYPKAKDMEDAFKIVGTPAAIEYKYDGFRVEINKDGDKIKIFTRRLENVSKQFPDLIKFVKDHVNAKQVILDAEAVGYDTKTSKYLPFQKISQRIRRKYDIEQMAKDFPVELNIFDILFYDGKNMIKEPFEERRKVLKKIIKNPERRKVRLAKQLITSNLKEAEKFYKESMAAGNEGVMVKGLEKPYKPGSRVGYGVKVKDVMDALDLVIVGATWGEGKRAKWFTSFTLACREGRELLEIGKVGTGIKELESEDGEVKGSNVTFDQLTKLIKPLITEEKGKTVTIKADIVVEIEYEEIQKSPSYSSGYALRFPRLIRLREDRSPSDVSTIHEIEDLYKGQRGR